MPSDLYLPEAEQIAGHAMAFARAMFAHSAFEREVAALQDVITQQDGFGERPQNQWGARERPNRMRALIQKYRGPLPETDGITSVLSEAIEPSEQRNLLAHGTWWLFIKERGAIVVRSGTRWGDPVEPPIQREYTAAEIRSVAEKLIDLEVKLYMLRRSIEAVDRVWGDDCRFMQGGDRK